MNPLCQAGLKLQEFMQGKEWPFCFIGGLAVIRWREVRMTQDAAPLRIEGDIGSLMNPLVGYYLAVAIHSVAEIPRIVASVTTAYHKEEPEDVETSCAGPSI